jgi:hypothetical protein
MNRGIVVLDTNALKWFVKPESRRRLERSLTVAGLSLRISAINVLEILKTDNPLVRGRLLETTLELIGDGYIIPGPERLLKASAQALLAGMAEFRAPESRLEWIVRSPGRIKERNRIAAKRLLAHQESVWEASHAKARRIVRGIVKKNHGRDPWGSVARFLDEQWSRPEQLDEFLIAMWKQLDLSGDAPVRKLLDFETWRIYFEAQGAVIYERAVAAQTTRPAQMTDVKQLVYLSGAQRRILVTDDGPFRRVAHAVLARRYTGSRILTPSQFASGLGGHLESEE